MQSLQIYLYAYSGWFYSNWLDGSIVPPCSKMILQARYLWCEPLLVPQGVLMSLEVANKECCEIWNTKILSIRQCRSDGICCSAVGWLWFPVSSHVCLCWVSCRCFLDYRTRQNIPQISNLQATAWTFRRYLLGLFALSFLCVPCVAASIDGLFSQQLGVTWCLKDWRLLRDVLKRPHGAALL